MKFIFNDYLKFVKFSHTIFALPFALIGFFLAVHTTDHHFELKLLILVILCMVFARNAAMAFNRYTDRKFDKKNPRTSARQIPAGVISEKSALYFVVINAVLFILTTWFINQLCFFLSPIALLVVLGYSYTKRFTTLCHFVLGTGLGLAPLGAYIAVTGSFAVIPVLISFIVFFWVSGFDIIYALQDTDFDKKNQLKSIPSKLGKKRSLHVSLLLHFIVGVLVLLMGFLSGFDMIYWIGAIIFILLLFYQHLIISPKDLRRITLAFFTTNGIASIVFAIFTIVSMYSNNS